MRNTLLYYFQRRVTLKSVLALLAGIYFLLLSTPGFGQPRTLTKQQYRDKTLAMILGSIGGALTGYEYLNVYNTPNGFYQPGATQKVPKEPLLGMPDNWFILLNGTLGGTTKDEHNYGSWFTEGRMNSDDDQHIDFFNQFLLNQYGPGISYQDIKKEWMDREVSDFGGGQGAIEVMRDKNLLAPQCGHRDHGNSGHWLPECYIEHEMMGGAFPGMPNKSVEFTEKFSSITGEGENVQWGYYWAAAHSIAYFETDVRTTVVKALGMLPANCRPRQMYDICVNLHKKHPNDWRAAVRELWKEHWTAPFAVGYDKVMMLGDVNNGTAFLSILYGANDYMTTLKIVSLAGGDGDCTASAVCGLLGIIKGMAGTPADFKNRIYKNNQGVWINDIVHAFSIKKNYKIEWKYDELVDMFQKNAESMIRAYGGVVTSTGYTIVGQSGSTPQIGSTNWDFELGTLEGWKTWTSGGNSSIWNERQCNDNTQSCFAATGKHKGTILTSSATAQAKLFQTITNLKPGATYKIEGRINTGGREARLYVENYGGSYKYASIFKGVSPFPFMYLYVTMGPTNTTLDVGLHAPPSASESKWCSIDDIIITQIEKPSPAVRYEAENAVTNNGIVYNNTSASGGKIIGSTGASDFYIEFKNVMASYAGEHIVRINYANGGDFAAHKVTVNGTFIGLLEHSDTGPWDAFSANVTDAYVKLNKGANTIRLSKDRNGVDIDYIELLSPYGSEGRPGAEPTALVSGGIYKIVSKLSNKVMDLKEGNNGNGGQIIQNDYTGAITQYFKVQKNNDGNWSITPLSNSAMCMETLGATTNNGDLTGLWGCWNGENQQWAIYNVGGGYSKIINVKSAKCCDVAGISTASGASVIQWDYLEGANQQWRFDLIGMSDNLLPHPIPGKIEAEKYSDSLGIKTEACTDIGTGKNIGFIESGDWVEYNTIVASAGKYIFNFRAASLTNGGIITVKSNGTVLGTVTIPKTGGWQTWTTITKEFTLSQGTQKIRLDFSGAAGSLFNLNWIETFLNAGNLDCNGTPNGTATKDVCGECVGGTTGKTTLDTDGDGTADCEDKDDDNDGVSDQVDCEPKNTLINTTASVWYADADGDGAGDSLNTKTSCIQPAGYVASKGDKCPADKNKLTPGICGCNKADTDTDKDGVADCNDKCPGSNDAIDANKNGIPDGCDVVVPACPNLALAPSLWTLRNDWSDQNNGSSIGTNSDGSMRITHRQWGNAYLWMISSGIQLDLKAGDTYTISFDYKDGAPGLAGMDAGFANGSSWSGPGLTQPVVIVPSGFNASSFTAKTVTIKSSFTGKVNLVLRLRWASQPSSQVNASIKNIKVCKQGSAARSSELVNEEILSSPETLSAYPNPASDVVYLNDGLDPEATCTIIDMYGIQRAASISYKNGKASISIAYLSDGLYIISVKDKNGNTSMTNIVISK